ncbi:MAG: BolA family transcriptional regulator [Oculatellaceae cyanobacterium bins.114]|nr:BolA family transcriptional regulator [Oculatellaceae cyanobacterium bins.114]
MVWEYQAFPATSSYKTKIADLEQVFIEVERMISPSQVESMIKATLPDAQVQIQDLTGGGDHYQVVVVSSAFDGKGLVQQHQLVYGAVRQAMSTEAIHALSLKTYTPQAWAVEKQAS